MISLFINLIFLKNNINMRIFWNKKCHRNEFLEYINFVFFSLGLLFSFFLSLFSFIYMHVLSTCFEVFYHFFFFKFVIIHINFLSIFRNSVISYYLLEIKSVKINQSGFYLFFFASDFNFWSLRKHMNICWLILYIYWLISLSYSFSLLKKYYIYSI